MKKRIKLGIFIDGEFIPSYSGAANRFHYLSRYLQKTGEVDVTIFLGDRGWCDLELIAKENFKTIIFSTKDFYGNFELLTAYVKKEKIDVLQFDSIEQLLLQGLPLAKRLDIRLVLEAHYDFVSVGEKIGLSKKAIKEKVKLQKLIGKVVDGFICLSFEEKESFIKKLGIPEERLVVIPSGVDVHEISSDCFDPHSKTLVFLGNLFFGPNTEAVEAIAIKIFPKLESYGYSVLIGGDVPEEVRKKYERKNFRFTGPIPDLNTLFRGALFALAPIFHGPGMRIKILNYLAAGLPVITTSEGAKGFPNKNILIIEDNIEKYPDLILSKSADVRVLPAQAKVGSDYVRENLCWENIAKNVVGFYTKILEKQVVIRSTNDALPRDMKITEPAWLQEALFRGRFKGLAPKVTGVNAVVIIGGEVEPVKTSK